MADEKKRVKLSKQMNEILHAPEVRELGCEEGPAWPTAGVERIQGGVATDLAHKQVRAAGEVGRESGGPKHPRGEAA